MKAADRNQGTAGNAEKGLRSRKLAIVLLFLTLVSGYGFSSCNGSEEPEANANEEVNAEPANDLPANLSNALAARSEDDEGAYAVFRHNGEYHSRLPCLACHTRQTNAARIGLPGKVDHSPCAGCHTLQFQNKNSSICSVCHTDSDAGMVKAFPPLRSFGARFVHSKHSRTACATCHKPQGKTLSIPVGRSGHTTCFSCHTSKASNVMASCGTCHKPGDGRLQGPGNSRAFRANFSHAKHGRGQKLECAACHTVARGGGRRNEVSAPATAMHNNVTGTKVSCATCHNNERAFGAEDFANCKRCHTGGSFAF